MAQARLVQKGKPPPKSILDKFTYTGRMRYEIRMMDNKLYHVLIFETSGNLTVTGEFVGDVWLVGGGGAGMGTSTGTNVGRGGGGGYTTNAFVHAIVSGPIAIGAGGTTGSGRGGTTTYDGLSALGGYDGSHETYRVIGGGGGGVGRGDSTRVPGIGQGTTTRPFESLDMPPHAGGGAGLSQSTTMGDGGSDGGNGYAYNEATGHANGLGGLYGGADGGYLRGTCQNGLAYGGGGGGHTSAQYGATGAVMIRISA